MSKLYISDGIYARIEPREHGGWVLILNTEDKYQQPTNMLYLDPGTWMLLQEFVKRVTGEEAVEAE
jgi:hypothetical protein